MAGEEFKTHGVTSRTPEKILLGPGTIHAGLTFDSGTSSWNADETIIGATQGGNTLTITPEITQIEVDGKWVNAKGLAVKTGETATIEVNFAEITPEILEMVAIGETGTSEFTGYDVLESAPVIQEGHYIQNFAFVGKTIDQNPIIVVFDYALCTSGFSLAGASKENTVLPATFEAYNDVTDDLRRLAYHIYYPTPATTP